MARNRYAIIKSYFKGKLKIYSKPTTFRFLLTLPIRPLQVTKGRTLTKAFLDAHNVVFTSVGRFNPEIIIPKNLAYI